MSIQKLKKEVKMINVEAHFALDQEVGLVKEVKQQDVDGGVKINNYE